MSLHSTDLNPTKSVELILPYFFALDSGERLSPEDQHTEEKKGDD